MECIWNETMTDYHDLYLKCDVLLLADVFEKFRNTSLKKYELCPIHYIIHYYSLLECASFKLVCHA